MATQESSTDRRNTRQSLRAPVVEPGRKNCLFCGTLKKKLASSTTKQATSQLVTVEAENKLRNAAATRQDQRILTAISSGNLIAREVHYHKSCYHSYTRAETLARIVANRQKTDTTCTADLNASSIESSEDDFFSAVGSLLFDDCAVVPAAELTRLYCKVLGSTATCDNKKVKRLVLKKFGDTVTFVRRAARNTPELVYATEHAASIIAELFDRDSAVSDSSSDEEPGEDATSGESDGDDDGGGGGVDGTGVGVVGGQTRNSAKPTADELLVEQDNVRLVYHAARMLRRLCIEHARTRRVPSAMVNVTSVEAAVESLPGLLHNFLLWLLADDYDDVVSKQRIKTHDAGITRQVLSLGQDVMYRVTPMVPPKHVALGLALHHLFRSEKLVTVLNRFGHCVAYPQVLEREACIVERNLRGGQVPDGLPLAVDRSLPFYHVADNNDLNEETVDGKGTTHCTNTIIIQPALQNRVTPSATAAAPAA
eukprot:scpid90141/ scgid2362/ 